MAYLMGIDLGTASVKTVIISEDGDIKAVASRGYMFEVPVSGYAEQDPEQWWDAVRDNIAEALANAGLGAAEIACVGLSGQMHGAVMLDDNSQSVHNAILHCDGRSSEQKDKILARFPDKSFQKITYNQPFPGMQLLSLLWMRDNLPGVYSKIRFVMCPKDFIRYKLTGEIGTDSTDASGTLLYDMEKQRWSREIIDALELDRGMFADRMGESHEIAGKVTGHAAAETGLMEGTPVVFGGGDAAMQLIGNGVVRSGEMAAVIGSSGQLMIVSDHPVLNPEFNTNTFRHPKENTWYGMGAILGGGVTYNWFKRNFAPDKSFEELSGLAGKVDACSNGLLFFPCMLGERTPYMDAELRGAFLGLSMVHTQGHFARAIMEGVTFAMKIGMELLQRYYGSPKIVIASGGSANSEIWLQMEADILNANIHTSLTREQGCVGAAMAAGVGCGLYRDYSEAQRALTRVSQRVYHPDPGTSARYSEFFRNAYLKVYEGNKDIMHELCKY